LYVPLLYVFSYFVEWHARALSASEVRADLAMVDALTGLANRLRFFDRLEHAIAYGKRTGGTFAVYFVDLDGFKQVNDSYGHQAGDVLLVEVARRLRAALRESDTVARIGGDEFTVLTSPLENEEGAEVVARKLLAACASPIPLGERELDVRCSVGVARYPDDGDTADALMARADAAMYEAKRAGGQSFRLATRAPSH
jgi:diguanylate cyclase (GGDEF)-like protein